MTTGSVSRKTIPKKKNWKLVHETGPLGEPQVALVQHNEANSHRPIIQLPWA